PAAGAPQIGLAKFYDFVKRPSLAGTEGLCRVSAGWPRSHTATGLNPSSSSSRRLRTCTTSSRWVRIGFLLSRSSSHSIAPPPSHGMRRARPETRPRKIFIVIDRIETASRNNLRRHRRSLLLRLEHTYRPTVEDHVHRPTRLGDRRLLILRIAALATSLRCAAVSRTPDSTKHSADGQAIDSKLGPCRSRRPSLPEPSRRNSGR